MKGVFVSLFGMLCVAASLVAAHPQSTNSAYTQVARLPSVVNGQALYSFAHDPVDDRLYAASEQGLFWVDLTEATPRFKGPLVRKRLTSIEIAPDTGRLFYTTMDEVGMVKLRSTDPPVRLAGREWRTARLAYEPTRRQMYLATRDGRVRVFDAETGERSSDVVVPGDYANMLEAVPGRVFFTLVDRSGLFTIDAATKAVAEWPVDGPLVTPAYLDADPTGKYLFATYDRYVVAIDIARATVVGRLATAVGGRIAFDPERRLLIAAQYDEAGYPRIRLAAYRVDDGGITEETRLDNPSAGQIGLESLRGGGFLQSGHLSLFVWQLAETR
jgi:hypothetical protein